MYPIGAKFKDAYCPFPPLDTAQRPSFFRAPTLRPEGLGIYAPVPDMWQSLDVATSVLT